MNKHINLVLSCDENYIKLLVPCLISIIYNKNYDTSIDVSILETGISAYHKSKIKELESFKNTDNVKIEFINVENKSQNLVLNRSNFKKKAYQPYWSDAILYRLLIPQIFASKDKVLSLDVDLIIQKDLLDIYNEDFEDNYLIASKTGFPFNWFDSIYYEGTHHTPEYFYKNIFKLPSYMFEKGKRYYISAGVMMFNIKKINKNKKDGELISTFLQWQESLIAAEQDVIFKVFLDKIKDLGWVKHCIDENLDTIEGRKHHLKDMLRRLKNAHIIHYSWVKPYNLQRAFKTLSVYTYLKYMQMSYLAFPTWKIWLAKLNAVRKCLHRRMFFIIPHILFNGKN